MTRVVALVSLLCVLVSCSKQKDTTTPTTKQLSSCEQPLSPREITLDPDEVHQLVATNQRLIQHCYEEKLVRNPSLHGVINVNLYVNEHGHPTRVCKAESTLPSQQVVECVLQVFSQFRFAKRSEAAASTYPVTFSAH